LRQCYIWEKQVKIGSHGYKNAYLYLQGQILYRAWMPTKFCLSQWLYIARALICEKAWLAIAINATQAKAVRQSRLSQNKINRD
jgi:hypothetical protein